MNNGIYLVIMDLARLDLMVRSGFWRKVQAQGWYPVVVAETIQFRRSLNLLQRFEIETRVLGWDDKAVLLEQQFWCKGDVVAHALVRARFLKRTGVRWPRGKSQPGGWFRSPNPRHCQAMPRRGMPSRPRARARAPLRP